jgi:hypothetical protein
VGPSSGKPASSNGMGGFLVDRSARSSGRRGILSRNPRGALQEPNGARPGLDAIRQRKEKPWSRSLPGGSLLPLRTERRQGAACHPRARAGAADHLQQGRGDWCCRPSGKRCGAGRAGAVSAPRMPSRPRRRRRWTASWNCCANPPTTLWSTCSALKLTDRPGFPHRSLA